MQIPLLWAYEPFFESYSIFLLKYPLVTHNLLFWSTGFSISSQVWFLWRDSSSSHQKFQSWNEHGSCSSMLCAMLSTKATKSLFLLYLSLDKIYLGFFDSTSSCVSFSSCLGISISSSTFLIVPWTSTWFLWFSCGLGLSMVFSSKVSSLLIMSYDSLESHNLYPLTPSW